MSNRTIDGRRLVNFLVQWLCEIEFPDDREIIERVKYEYDSFIGIYCPTDEEWELLVRCVRSLDVHPKRITLGSGVFQSEEMAAELLSK